MGPFTPSRALEHLPGDLGWPFVGSTFRAMRDPVGLARERFRQYGPVYKARSVYMTSISLLGPDAAQHVLQDKGQLFSSQGGWKPNLGSLFPNSLMLQDFGEHRMHRQIMLDAFKRPAVERYAQIMDRKFASTCAQWGAQGRIDVYSEIKKLLLELGIGLFLGHELATSQYWVNRAMIAMTSASTSLLRRPIFGSTLRAGVEARERLAALVRELIPQARQAASGSVLNRLCTAVDEAGNYYSEQQIVDHMLFVVMAAHDTTTSAATSMLLELGTHAQWQERLRQETAPYDIRADGCGCIDDLAAFPLLDAVYRECLRLYPPVPAIPRYTLRDHEFAGHLLPAGNYVWLFPIFNHRDERWWRKPDEFDPTRFLPERAEDRQHKFIFVPFGGGAHTCIGLHVGAVMVKLLMVRLLQRFRIAAPSGPVPRSIFPFPRPSTRAWVDLVP